MPEDGKCVRGAVSKFDGRSFSCFRCLAVSLFLSASSWRNTYTARAVVQDMKGSSVRPEI